MEIVPYRGWTNNLRLSNGTCELIVTLDVGPRVIAYRFIDGFNVMKNYDSMMGGTNEPEWQIRGGHRFWLAPEDLTRTYFADNRPVKWENSNGTAIFTPPAETEYGVQKQMMIKLHNSGTKVDVTLKVTNVGKEPTTLAPWGPTVMAAGGVEIIPLPAKSPHPGHVFLRQDVNKGPTKIGIAHREGWVGYLNSHTLFVKRFDYRQGAVYPDRGTRYQTFSNEDMLEMETCGEMATLKPGESASLIEQWELFKDVPNIETEADADRIVKPLVAK
jgi:hypothetical protein